MLRQTLNLIQRAYRYVNRKEISDSFLTWLTFANAGMLHPGNLYCLDHAIRNMPDTLPIVEIGSFCGLSTNVITYLKEKHGRNNILFSCDKWVFEGADAQDGLLAPTSTVTHAEFRHHVRESFIRNVALFSRTQLPHTIEVFSDEFFALWRRGAEVTDVFGRLVRLGGQIGFCYIDGNHRYEYASRDFVNADEFLAPGGFILFDDSADFAGVQKVVAEVVESGRYQLAARNPNHLFTKRATS